MPPSLSPLETAARELREETGFVACRLQHVCSLHPNTATHRNLCHTVLALDVMPSAEMAHEAGEDIVVETMPLAAVVAGLNAGLLAQAMNVAALLLAVSAAGRLELSLRP
ncbi:NUDIX hydrolase [Pseudoroseomonas wenyumeiae]